MSASTASLARSRLWPRLRAAVIVTPPARGARTAGRRARHAVLWGAAVILAANVALSVAVETVLPQVRDPEFGVRLVRLQAQQRAHPDRPLVVMVGTSRTQNGIDPRAMFPDEPGSPLVFNFGQSSVTPVTLRLNVQRIRAGGIRPAAVLVEVLPESLGAAGPVPTAHVRPERLSAADVRWLRPHLADPDAVSRRWAAARVNPWPAHRQVVVNHVAPRWHPWPYRIEHLWTKTDDRGFGPYQYETTSAESRARRRAAVAEAFVPVLRDLRVSGLTEESFRGIVADCREWGVPVAFYEMPESPVVRSWYSPESRAAVAALNRLLRDELRCAVFDPPDDFAEDEFADGHHLLRAGAARLSAALAERHLKPWLGEHR